MKSILTASILLLSIPAFSCGKDSIPDKSKWSAGMILMNTSRAQPFGFRPAVFPGIIVRRDLGSFRLRGATEIQLYQNRPNRYGYPDESYTSEKSFGLQMRLGIEKGWNLNSWIRPYLGLDLTAGLSNTNVIQTGGIAGIHSERTLKQKYTGLLPLAGIEFMLGNRLSISAETQFGFLLVNEYDHTIYYQGNIDSRPQESDYFNTSYEHPVSVAMHFHF